MLNKKSSQHKISFYFLACIYTCAFFVHKYEYIYAEI